MRSTRLLTVMIGLVAIVSVACGDDGGSASAADESLPPNDFEQLAEMFDPELRPLGLRLTRGALVDTDGGYEVSDTGRHLAVYVEPTGDEYTAADYLDGIVPSARVFLPRVFERWPDLETFDVCQEPLASVDYRDEPPPVTQLFLSRKDARDIDWETVTVDDLLATAEATGSEFRLHLDPELRAEASA